MKKFYLLFIVFGIIASLGITSAKSAIYLEEDFESSTIPPGWRVEGCTEAYYSWSVTGATSYLPAYRGTKYFRYDSSWSNSMQKRDPSILISPSVLIQDRYAAVSFYFMNPNGGEMKFYVSLDNGVTYEELLDSNFLFIDNWTKKTYDVGKYVGQEVSFVFVSYPGLSVTSETVHLLDWFRVYSRPVCAGPDNIYATEVSSNSANIQWTLDTDGDVPSHYYITVWDDDNNYLYYNHQFESHYNQFQLTGLNASSNYYITITGDCYEASKGRSNPSKVYTLRTLCEGITPPYLYTFDDVANNGLPECWKEFTTSKRTYVYPYLRYGTSGKSFLFAGNSAGSSYFTTIPINHEANDIQIEFMLYSRYWLPIEVGLMSDVEDMSTFDRIGYITISKPLVWEKVRLNTRNTNYGTQKNLFLCFKMEQPLGSPEYYIDNLLITSIPNCTRPENPVVKYADSTNVSLYWDDNNVNANYEVEINDGVNATRYEVVNTNSCIVNNLTPTTNYTFRIRSICTPDTSEWSNSVTATTGYASFNVPLYENFDASSTLPVGWNAYVTPGKYTFGTFQNWRPYSSTIYHTDGNAAYAYGNLAGTKYVLQSPALNIPQNKSYEVVFWMYRYEPYIYDSYLKVYVNTIPSLEGAIFIDSIGTSINDYPREIEGGATFYEYYFDIPLSGIVYVMFDLEPAGVTYCLLDNIAIVPKNNCHAKINNFAHFINPYDNSFDLKWHSLTSESQWLVNTTITDLSTNSVVCEITNALCNDSSYTLNYSQYVQPGTEYRADCSVRALCVDTSRYFDYSFEFKTPCILQSLPLTQNFDGTVFPPSCWTNYTLRSSAQPHHMWTRTTSSAHGAGAAEMAVADSATISYLVSPKMTFSAGVSYELSFNMFRNELGVRNDNEGIIVWLSTVPDDYTNAQQICVVHRDKTLSPVVEDDGFYNYKYDVNVNTTGEYYLIFEGIQEGGSAIVIDDVHLIQKPNCSTFEVENVHLLPRYNSVDLSIYANAVVEISIVETTDEVTEDVINNGIKYRFVVDSINNEFTISGLSEQTTYSLFVRNICDSVNNVVSNWSEFGKQFTTICEPLEIRDTLYLFEDFEGYTANVTFPTANKCYEFAATSIPVIKESLGLYLTWPGTTCVPYSGTKQMAVNGVQSGRFGYPVHLYQGRTYQVSVLSRLSNVGSSPSTLNFYLRKLDNNENTVISQIFDANIIKWNKFKTYFTVEVEGDYYVGFEYKEGTATRYMAFDDFEIRECVCATPSDIEVVASNYHSVSFSIIGNAPQYEVRICMSMPAFDDEDPAAIITDTVNTLGFTVEGLSPQTDYYAVVRSLCAEGNSDWSTPIAFRSDCYSENLPYITSFEDNCELNCWHSVEAVESEFSISDDRARYGNKSLKAKSTLVISPDLNVTSLADCMVSGWVYAEQNAPTTVNVGVIVNKYDISTYDVVTSFTVDRSNEWVKFTALLSGLSDPDYEDLLAATRFVLDCNEDAVYYFDEIEVTRIPSCFKTGYVTANILNNGDIKVDWPVMDNESSWKISVYQVFDDGRSILFDSIVNTNTCTFSNLPSIAYYQFGVTTLCSAENVSEIVYSDPIKALCTSAYLPYVSDFGKTEPECWNITANAENSLRSWKYNSEGYYYAYPYLGNVSDIVWLEMPLFKLKSNNGVYVNLDGFIQTSFDTIPVRLEYSVNGGNYVTVSDNCLNRNIRGNNVVFIPQVGPGTLSLRIVSEHHAYCNLFLYGVKVSEVEDCAAPANVEWSINNDVVNVSIVDNEHSSWEYVYEQGNFNPDYRTPIAVQSNTFTLNHLPLFSLYNLYVRTNCGNEKSSWYGPVLIKTRCVEALPYTVDFNNLTDNSDILKECYYIYSDDANNRDGQNDMTSPYVDINEVPGSLSMTSSENHAISLVLPEFESDVNYLTLSFDYKNEGVNSFNTPLVVGIVNPSDFNTFVAVKECPLSASMRSETINFTKELLADIDYSDYQIAFKYGAGDYDGFFVTIDNIEVSQAVKCSYAPEISLTAVAENSLTFNSVYFADSLQISYSGSGLPVNENNILSVTDRQFTVNNLSSGTVYDIYIRNKCNGSTGEWYGPYAFATKCGVITITDNDPWVEDFDADINPLYPFPICMVRNNISTVNNVIYPSVVNTTPSNTLELKEGNFVALPQFNQSLDSYRLVVYAKGSGNMSVGAVFDNDLDNYNSVELSEITNTTQKYEYILSASYNNIGNRIAISAQPGSDLIIDKIEVYNLTACYEPTILDVTPYDTAISVELSLPSSSVGIEYRLTSENSQITNTIQRNSSYLIRNLTPDTEYMLEIRSICSNDTSDWTSVEFKTLCTPISVSANNPYIEGFETVTSGENFTTALPCWVYESASGTGTLKALSGTKNDVAYVPFDGTQAMNIPYDNKILISNSFNLTAGTYEISYYAVQSESNGSCEIKTRRRGEKVWNSEFTTPQSIREFYEPVVTKLVVTENGVYDVLFIIDTKGQNSGSLSIDNISVKATNVLLPSQLDVVNITSTTADVTWKALSDSHHVVVEEVGGDTIYDAVVNNGTSTVSLSGLELGGSYVVTLNAIGSDNSTSAPISVTFSTVCDILTKYHNDFDAYDDFERPSCWEVEFYNANGVEYSVADNIAHWSTKYVANRRALFLNSSEMASNSSHALYSPQFNISDGMSLNFDCYNNVTGAHLDSLVVTIVSNGVESNPIAIVTSEVMTGKWYQFGYSLKDYVGSTIRVKFYSRSNSAVNNNQYIGIDNFSISKQVEGETYQVTLCENENYTENGFNVPSSQLNVGVVNTLTRVAIGADNVADTLYKANVYVPDHVFTDIYDTICSGDAYNKGLFSNLIYSGRYVQKTNSSYHCDSSIVLHLTVFNYNNFYDVNICEGEAYPFKNQNITQPGIYTDTLVSSWGCDSIVTISLNVSQREFEYTHYICEGSIYKWNDTILTTPGRHVRRHINRFGCDSIDIMNLIIIPREVNSSLSMCSGQIYYFGDTTLTTSGQYTKRFVNSLGCDSIVHLDLTVTPAPIGRYEDYVCEGQGYYNYGFMIDNITRDTLASRTIPLSNGCDSIVEVSLKFIPTAVENITVTIEPGESYELAGNTYTEPGNYTGRFYTELGCDSIVNLTLIVSTSVDNVYTLPVAVAPNPIRGGEVTYLVKDWTDEEKAGMTVEVLNSVGQRLMMFKPNSYPISIDGIYTAGVYHIRVISGTGDVYIGKLIVK